jgi:hypothetical protein
MCQRALTKVGSIKRAKFAKKKTLWGGGALELLEHAVLLDAARDDDGGGNTEPLA